MKYVCGICGYIYDEDKQSVKFTDLPEDWVCPICKAPKSEFKAEKWVNNTKSEVEKKLDKNKSVIENDFKEMSFGALSTLCSNLARGSEKQYKTEEQAMFSELAEYFNKISPKVNNAEIEQISKAVSKNIQEDYERLTQIAKENQDRGTQRVCVWGEKVSRMLKSLISRYEKEGEAFLNNTNVWVCSICGFIFIGDNAPALCPVCKVPDWKFEKIQER